MRDNRKGDIEMKLHPILAKIHTTSADSPQQSRHQSNKLIGWYPEGYEKMKKFNNQEAENQRTLTKSTFLGTSDKKETSASDKSAQISLAPNDMPHAEGGDPEIPELVQKPKIIDSRLDVLTRWKDVICGTGYTKGNEKVKSFEQLLDIVEKYALSAHESPVGGPPSIGLRNLYRLLSSSIQKSPHHITYQEESTYIAIAKVEYRLSEAVQAFNAMETCPRALFERLCSILISLHGNTVSFNSSAVINLIDLNKSIRDIKSFRNKMHPDVISRRTKAAHSNWSARVSKDSFLFCNLALEILERKRNASDQAQEPISIPSRVYLDENDSLIKKLRNRLPRDF
jgi:hypothetical protein